ncbi:VOC family protein [Roseomonas sp. NAR14]|uniref:VOC family protein n=1 Tax=Roseomonas acroporae TaxID=2937791 RepID=A0A9X2BTL3_9PROT|nr:VOC family protein [Roseomonas acroporae]MCK8783341.1 VOC family protein [Roseomonas acroporae]
MSFSGIESVTFGVADMEEARRFLDDWGLRQLSATADRLVYETKDGGQAIVRPKDAPDLPPAIEPGNTVREVIWGTADEAALRDALARLGDTEPGADGIHRTRDPNGLSLGFTVSRRRKVVTEATPANAPGTPRRLDRRSPVHDHAEPIKIGHVVLFAADFAAMRAFYTERMGFIVSDEYPNHGAFMRCQVVGEHHNLFILNRPGKPGVNHVAFTVTDIHEVIGGGLAMSRKGWKTEIGPGRHPISSAYFWYFENPLAAPVEYYADDDYCTEAWQAQTFERKPELFAEWAIAGGIDGKTRRQVVTVDNSGRGHA